MIKVSFNIDQSFPLYEDTEKIIRSILCDRSAFGYYTAFLPDSIKIEEVPNATDTEKDSSKINLSD